MAWFERGQRTCAGSGTGTWLSRCGRGWGEAEPAGFLSGQFGLAVLDQGVERVGDRAGGVVQDLVDLVRRELLARVGAQVSGYLLPQPAGPVPGWPPALADGLEYPPTRRRPKNCENRRATAVLTTQKTAPSKTQKTRFAMTLLANPIRKPMPQVSPQRRTMSSPAGRRSGCRVP